MIDELPESIKKELAEAPDTMKILDNVKVDAIGGRYPASESHCTTPGHCSYFSRKSREICIQAMMKQ